VDRQAHKYTSRARTDSKLLAVIPAIARLRLRKRPNRFTTCRRVSPLPQVLRRRQSLV
jgi:hypothetical protein